MPASGIVLIRYDDPFPASLLSSAEQAADLADHQQDGEEAVEEYGQAHDAEPADLDGAGQAAAVQLYQQDRVDERHYRAGRRC